MAKKKKETVLAMEEDTQVVKTKRFWFPSGEVVEATTAYEAGLILNSKK